MLDSPNQTNRIAYFCIFLGALGIIYYLLEFSYAIPAIYKGLGWLPFTFLNNFGGRFTRLLSVVFYVLIFIGGLNLSKKKNDQSGLVRFTLSAILGYTFIFLIATLFTGSIGNFSVSDSKTVRLLFTILWIATRLFLLYFCFTSINRLDKDSKADLGIFTFIESSNVKRALNLGLDFLVACAIMNSLYGLFIFNIQKHNINIPLRELIFGFIIVMRLLYYLFYAVLIKSTPAKYLTGTYVFESESSLTPGKSKMLLNVLCRFIPLDALSFLMGWNWHDRLSGTEVYEKEINTMEGTEQIQEQPE